VRVLDLFCGGGGASAGYANVFDVYGVDIKDQRPGYRHDFVRADAVELLKNRFFTAHFDVFHASPPCQAYSKHVSSASSKWTPTKGKDEPKLIHVVRDLLDEIGKPYIIENVMGAMDDMKPNLMLCGSMFGLPTPRHRIFECRGFKVEQLQHPKCAGIAKRFAAEKGWEYRDMSVTGKGRRAGTTERWKEILGVDWDVTQAQLAEMIPPAYTRYIAEQFKSDYIHDCVIGGDTPSDAKAEWGEL